MRWVLIKRLFLGGPDFEKERRGVNGIDRKRGEKKRKCFEASLELTDWTNRAGTGREIDRERVKRE